MVKRKALTSASRDCFGFANNIYEEAFKELYNLSSYKRPFETLCYLFVTMAGMVCMLDVHGKRQTAKKTSPTVCVLPSVHLCERTCIACERENLRHFCIGGIEGLEAK